jgi:hypothetical protein
MGLLVDSFAWAGRFQKSMANKPWVPSGLVILYADADATPLMQFIVDCRPEG